MSIFTSADLIKLIGMGLMVCKAKIIVGVFTIFTCIFCPDSPQGLQRCLKETRASQVYLYYLSHTSLTPRLSLPSLQVTQGWDYVCHTTYIKCK